LKNLLSGLLRPVLLLAALVLVSAHGVVRASWFAAVLDRAPTLAWLGSIVTRWATSVKRTPNS
jgi:hypothetical protein